MNHEQVIDLLSLAAAFDKRKIGETEVHAWHLAIGHLEFADCEQAIADHYRESTDYLMPVHVAAGVKRIRRERLDRSITVPPPADDPAAYRAHLQAQIKAIADGRFVNRVLAIEPGRRGEIPREVSQARGEDDAAAVLRRAALRVDCPHCRARPGKRCTLSGTSEPLTSKPAHDARLAAAGAGT